MNEFVTYAVIKFGPLKRPSVTNWLWTSPNNVYIGPPTPALLGSGDDHEEFDRVEAHHGSKFIHFFTAAGIDYAIRDFCWKRGVEYSFGYHPVFVDEGVLRAFCTRLTALMATAGLGVTFQRGEDMLTTVHLQHTVCASREELDAARAAAALATQQHIFIGAGSVWGDVAATTTLAIYREHAPPHALHETSLAAMSSIICGSSELSALWLGEYRYRLLRSERAQPMISGDIPLMDGAVFWLERDMARAGDVVPGMPCQPWRNSFALHDGLLQLVTIVELLTLTGSAVEIRYLGTHASPTAPGPDSYEDDEANHITMSSVCLSCCRIMPDLSKATLHRLRDPNTTGKARAEIFAASKRPYHPCCFEAMMSPVNMDVPSFNSLLYNVNPAVPPPPSDLRTIVYNTHFQTQSPLWTVERLLWSNTRGLDTAHDVLPKRRYMVRYNIPQINTSDYGVLCRNPGGFVDHMNVYHYPGGCLTLDNIETRALRPPSEIAFK